MKYLLITLLLAGCSTTNNQLTFVEVKDVRIDNSAKNNFGVTHCKYYVNDHCILDKKQTPRNPDNPLKNDRR
jgi:hypothetical protein